MVRGPHPAAGTTPAGGTCCRPAHGGAAERATRDHHRHHHPHRPDHRPRDPDRGRDRRHPHPAPATGPSAGGHQPGHLRRVPRTQPAGRPGPRFVPAKPRSAAPRPASAGHVRDPGRRAHRRIDGYCAGDPERGAQPSRRPGAPGSGTRSREPGAGGGARGGRGPRPAERQPAGVPARPARDRPRRRDAGRDRARRHPNRPAARATAAGGTRTPRSARPPRECARWCSPPTSQRPA
jgi:hypothetical protein